MVELNDVEQVRITVESESASEDILVSVGRIYAELSDKEMEDVERLMLDCREFFGERGELIGDADILIAATATAQDYSLVTNNKRHFDRVLDPRVEN